MVLKGRNSKEQLSCPNAQPPLEREAMRSPASFPPLMRAPPARRAAPAAKPPAAKREPVTSCPCPPCVRQLGRLLGHLHAAVWWRVGLGASQRCATAHADRNRLGRYPDLRDHRLTLTQQAMIRLAHLLVADMLRLSRWSLGAGLSSTRAQSTSTRVLSESLSKNNSL